MGILSLCYDCLFRCSDFVCKLQDSCKDGFSLKCTNDEPFTICLRYYQYSCGACEKVRFCRRSKARDFRRYNRLSDFEVIK